MSVVRSRLQFFKGMSTRIDSAKVSNVNMSPCGGSTSHSKGLGGPRYYRDVRIRGDKNGPHTREDGLFADYINTFLKLKAEASGYPSWVGNPEDEERYVKNLMLENAC